MDESTAATDPQGGGRTIWLGGAIVAMVIVVIAAVLFVAAGDREDAAYAPGSPEAAYQAYLRAWEAGDVDTAWASLTSQAQDRVDEYEFRAAARWRDEERVRIWIDDVDTTAERATLHVTIETTYDGLLGPDHDRHDAWVRLVREDGEWRIASPLIGYDQW